jgi:hypothetical protein
MLIEIPQRLEQPPFLKTRGFVGEFETAAGVVLPFKVFCLARADYLEIPVRKSLAAFGLVQKVIGLFVVTQIIEEFDVIVCIHF